MNHLNTDRLYESEELAKKALRKGRWKENRNGWSRIPKTWPQSENVEVAKIVLFEGKHKISTEVFSKSEIDSISAGHTWSDIKI